MPNEFPGEKILKKYSNFWAGGVAFSDKLFLYICNKSGRSHDGIKEKNSFFSAFTKYIHGISSYSLIFSFMYAGRAILTYHYSLPTAASHCEISVIGMKSWIWVARSYTILVHCVPQCCLVLEKPLSQSLWHMRLPLSHPIWIKPATAVRLQLAQSDANAPSLFPSPRVKIEHDWIRLLARPSECGFREWERFWGFFLIIPRDY